MAKNLKRDENEFNITFEGEINSVDVNLLTTTLLNFNTLIQEINKDLKTGKEVTLEIQTFRPGSYDIFCALAGDVGLLNSLFNALTKDNILFASTIISTLADILSIKEFLGGEKPKSIERKDDKIIIKNNKDKVIVKSQKAGDIIFNNPTINVTVNNTFNTLQDISQIKGITIKDNKGEAKFETKRENFDRLATPNPIIEEKTEETKTLNKYQVNLNIFKIVFGTKYKWEFYYEGNKVSATIEDEVFYERMINREVQFMNGDILVVDLEINQSFNSIANTFENKKYVIKKVHDVKHLPRQTKFDL